MKTFINGVAITALLVLLMIFPAFLAYLGAMVLVCTMFFVFINWKKTWEKIKEWDDKL